MKNNILAFVIIVIFTFLIYLAQIYLIGDRTLFSVKPNLLLISVLVISLWYGVYIASIYGFCIGFICDTLFSSNPGMFLVCYTICALIIGLIQDERRKKERLTVIYSTFICVAVFQIIQYTYYAALTGTFSNFIFLIKNIVMESLLNIVIAFIFYGFILKFSEKIESKFRKRGAI